MSTPVEQGEPTAAVEQHAPSDDRTLVLVVGSGRSGTSLFTGIMQRLGFHVPQPEVGADPTYANRSASKRYRATPLRGLAQHAPYFHDGSAPTLEAVVTHYNGELNLQLTAQQQADLVQYLKSL